jgi:hypothetical protein
MTNLLLFNLAPAAGSQQPQLLTHSRGAVVGLASLLFVGMRQTLGPVFGVSYNSFTDHHERTTHNSFVLCFAELGLLGYFTWLALVVTG